MTTAADLENPYNVISMHNNRLVGVVEETDKVIAELAASESATAGGSAVFDRARLDKWNDKLVALMNTAKAETGKTDGALSHWFVYDIRYWSNQLEVEVVNTVVRDLIREYFVLMVNASRCDSARHSSGCTQPDYDRWMQQMDNIKQYLTDYVDKITPTDTPTYDMNPSKYVGTGDGTAATVSVEDRLKFGPLAIPKVQNPGNPLTSPAAPSLDT